MTREPFSLKTVSYIQGAAPRGLAATGISALVTP